MKEFIQPILEFVKSVVDRWGMKSLVALGAIYAIYDLAKTGVLTPVAAIAIGGIAVGFFVFRFIQEKNGVCTQEEDTDEDA